MAWDTVANILSDAAVELGLTTADIADPYGSQDANVIQLLRFLKGLGQDLLREHSWSHLSKTHTFSTVNGTAAYDPPSDFARLTDGTEWNRTQQMRLGGPVTPHGWHQLQALSSAGTLSQLFRIFNDQLQLHPTPTAAETLAFEYQGRYWVKESGQSAPNTETPDAANDTLCFDRRLLVTGTKLAFLRAKGFDSSAAQDDFERALSRAKGADGAAPVLSIGGSSSVRLVDESNIPETGFGS